jgi:hypothetical protein
MIGLLNDRELQLILGLALERVNQVGSVFHSFASLLVAWVALLSPKVWMRLAFVDRSLSRTEESLLTPLSAIKFAMVFPGIHFFLSLRRLPDWPRSSRENESSMLSVVHQVVQSSQPFALARIRHVFSLFSAS